MNVFDYLFKDVGIDLGTANSLIYLKGHGLLINEPTVVAVNNKTSQIIAAGEEAKKMTNRTPAHISVVRPLIGGVISDFEMTEEILRQYLKKTSKGSVFSYRRGILAIPDNLTEVERKSVEDAALNAGCAKVFLIESPIAAALGADLPIHLPMASLIIDIGGGTTDIAVISLNGIVISRTLKIAGDKFNDDIIKFVRDEFHIAIGEPTAEMAKIVAGSALPIDEHFEFRIAGRDLATGLPKETVIKDSHLRMALAKSLKSIVESIKDAIESTPPELVGDMVSRGIYICGGGALLRGIDKLIEKETGISVKVVPDPLTCVTRGLGKIVEDFDYYKKILNAPLSAKSIKL